MRQFGIEAGERQVDGKIQSERDRGFCEKNLSVIAGYLAIGDMGEKRTMGSL
jgi:hypothetical protein